MGVEVSFDFSSPNLFRSSCIFNLIYEGFFFWLWIFKAMKYQRPSITKIHAKATRIHHIDYITACCFWDEALNNLKKDQHPGRYSSFYVHWYVKASSKDLIFQPRALSNILMEFKIMVVLFYHFYFTIIRKKWRPWVWYFDLSSNHHLISPLVGS